MKAAGQPKSAWQAEARGAWILKNLRSKKMIENVQHEQNIARSQGNTQSVKPKFIQYDKK